MLLGIHNFKLNGNVISFKVYENAGDYGGKMAVFLGQEKTEYMLDSMMCFSQLIMVNPDKLHHQIK